jgi:hypothetical protein
MKSVAKWAGAMRPPAALGREIHDAFHSTFSKKMPDEG